MAKIKIQNNKMALFMVCEAICDEREEFKDLKPDEDGLYDLSITLNGRELNVERFLENLQRSYNDAVRNQAASLLKSEYDKMLGSIYEIQEALNHHNKLFEQKVYGIDTD